MAIPQDFLYQSFQNKTTFTILASDLTFTADLIDPTRDYEIYADIITLDKGKGALNFPGHNVTIYCRDLDTKGVAISTQPRDPILPAPEPKPKTSDDPAVNKGNPNGQNADPIEKKDFGPPGGNITIMVGSIANGLTLNSSGGKGRDGQAGGDAGRGADGRAGKDDEPRYTPHFGKPAGKNPGSPGTDGSQGGNGGDGGKPGDGGNAGSIMVSVVADPPNHVSTTVVGGSPGVHGKPGSKAPGGKEGAGGKEGDWETEHHGHGAETYRWVWNGHYPDGAHGASGQDGRVIEGKKGADGTVTVESIDDVRAKFVADDHLFAQLQLMMQVVKLHYLDRDFQRAKDVLTWIYGLTDGRSSATDSKKWGGLHKQARAYLSRLSRGLDFFGNAANFVPLASFALYCSTVTSILTLGGEIENVFQTYTQFLANQQAGYTDFTKAFSKAAQAIKGYQDTEQATIELRKQLWDDCLKLDSQIVVAKTNMSNAEERFKMAVDARAKCMQFEAILTMITAIIAVPVNVTDAMTAIEEATASIAAIKILAGGVAVPSDFLNICKNIKAVKDDFTDVATQWKDIQASLAQDGPDSGKLVTEVSAFDDQIAPYMDMPEAQKYKRDVHAYIDLCKARNAKVVQCSKLDELVLQVEGKIVQTQTQMDELKAQEAGSLDPSLAPYRNFLLALYNDFKDSLMDYLFYETLAYRYRTLKDFPKILQSGNSLAELNAMQSDILKAVVDYENKAKAIEQPFQNLVVHPLKNATDYVVASFKAGGDLQFVIPTTEASFQGFAHIRATAFCVSLPGLRLTSSNNRVYVKLICLGNPTVMDTDARTFFQFTHNPVTVVYEYELIIDDKGNTEEHYLAGGALVDSGDGQDAKTIALSPFCTWTLSLPRTGQLNEGVDISQVTDIILSFSGKGLPSGLKKRVVS